MVGRYLCAMGGRTPFDVYPETIGGDEPFVAVLLEEQPLKNQGTVIRIFRQIVGALGEIREYCVAFGKRTAVGADQQRHLAVRVERQKFIGSGLALQYIRRDIFERQVELLEQQPHLIAVSRIPHSIELVHSRLMVNLSTS